MNDHPLAKVHSGTPRGSMLNLYFRGHRWFGLYGEKLRVVYRPAEIAQNGVLTGKIHMSIYQKP